MCHDYSTKPNESSSFAIRKVEQGISRKLLGQVITIMQHLLPYVLKLIATLLQFSKEIRDNRVNL